LLVFAFTGLALNHSDKLGLDRHHLQHRFWQRLYPLDPDIKVTGLEDQGHWFSHAGGRLYFDQRYITASTAANAVVRLNDFWAISNTTEILLIDDQGSLLERITAEQLPGRIRGLEQHGHELIIYSRYANFVGDIDSLNWRVLAPDGVQQAPPPRVARSRPPAPVVDAIHRDVRAHAFSLERLLLDIHNGQLFGLVGVVVMDSAAFALIALSVSGLLLWVSYRRKQGARKRRNRHKT
jgi:hypothetical protein